MLKHVQQKEITRTTRSGISLVNLAISESL